VYYTYGTPGKILVHNHLDTILYGAVSDLTGWNLNSRGPIEPGQQQLWRRSADERIHISTPMNHAGEQSAQVYNARVGMVLHIQNLEGQERWQGALQA
jgi:hypothetical protein